MRKTYAIVIVLITLIFPFRATVGQNKQTQNVKLTVLNSMERISQDQSLFGADQVDLKLAKNETGSFQVIIGAIGKNIKVVDVRMSDLTGSSITIDKKNFNLFKESYVRVRQSSPQATMPPGLYSDPLIPFTNPQTGDTISPRIGVINPQGRRILKGFGRSAIPFEVWQGQNRPVWVDIAVPKGANSGKYKGTFTLTTENGITYSIPVHLTVWNFALPDGPTLSSSFGNVKRVASLFDVDPNSKEFEEIEMRYYKMYSDNRINPPMPESIMPEVNDDGSLKITSERTQALRKFIQDLHITDFPVPRAPFKEAVTTNREKAIRYYRDYFRYVKENGWDKRAYLYMQDEPNTKQAYEEVLAYGKMVREATPSLKLLVTEQPYPQDSTWPDIDSTVDIWCPLFSFINRKAVNSKLAGGDEVWSYTALAQKTPAYNPGYNESKGKNPPYWAIDQPLISYRISTWINWQYKITGLLYWSTVAISRSLMGVEDPWELPILTIGSTYNGEGYLIYPGVPAGIKGPVASMRLKNIREGMQDYEYFALLEKLAGREAVTKIVSKVAPNWWELNYNPKTLLAVKEEIANMIMKLSK